MAPGARRGKGGASRLNINGRAGDAQSGSGYRDDAVAADGSAGPDRRVRSGVRRGGRGSASSSISGAGGGSPARARGPYEGRPSVNKASLAPLTSRLNRPSVIRPTGSKGAIDSLKQLVQSRWNAEARLLNLENLAADPVFKDGLLKAPGQKGAPKSVAPAMWKVASELCPDLQSLSLASNNLSTLVDLAPASLINYLPSIKNLSLSDNQISQYADLNPLSTVVGTITGSKPGLGELKELMLTGNPLQVNEMKKNAVDYQAEIRRRFPSLGMLDQVPIDQTIPVPTAPTAANGVSIAGLAKRRLDPVASTSGTSGPATKKRSKAALPLPVKPPFADTETSTNAMSQFLVKFITTFDNDRSQLEAAYSPEGTFSLCINSTPSERARRLQHLSPEQVAKQRELSWGTYLGSAYEQNATGHRENLSRNFMRIKNQARRDETLSLGPTAIVATVSKLPKTSHPLSDASKFIVDTWQQPGFGTYPEVLVVVVHGEFAEHPSMASRSFDRTFVLAPTAPGTAAAAAGWPCTILSDLLTIRSWANPSLWSPDSEPAPALVPSAPSTVAASNLPVLSEEQQTLMNQLHAHSRLNAQFCYQCLSETGWNLQAAVQAFEGAKASIPPEAFM